MADAGLDGADEVGGARRVPRHRRLRRFLVVLAVVLALVAGGGAVVYCKLNGNLTEASLYNGTGTAGAGAEKADPFGRVPINVLVIGSDSRATKADCRIGGDCTGGTGANADVEMVVHVSADRSNLTVMSIPRDLVTSLPACTDPATKSKVGARVGQINSTLSWGPGCTVAAVHQLTGIVIDHFMEVDFSGVIAISDAVGGVPVCVNNNVYDTYSHLKLSKGTHTLKGLAALEFVRSRHAFGDGSDLGRTYAQHVFLSSAVRQLKSTGVLLNPAALFKVANAATEALTVDKGLGSVSRLLDLAGDLNKVPTGRVTFTTMQTEADPSDTNRVIEAPAARKLFATIVADQSLSAAPKPKPTATPTAGATASATATASAEPTPSSSKSTKATASRKAALSQAHAQTATTSSCVPVSTQNTVQYDGIPMSPVQAYADAKSVKDSAP